MFSHKNNDTKQWIVSDRMMHTSMDIDQVRQTVVVHTSIDINRLICVAIIKLTSRLLAS